MISNKMAQRLNEQINFEFYSSYAYLAMSAYCQGLGFTGFANWFAVQAREEWGHGMKIYNYLYDQDQNVTLLTIKQPQAAFESVGHAFEETLKHEQQVTASINSLITLAVEEKDFATQSFLKWFVDEQVEEESSVKGVLDKLRLIKDSTPALMFLDRELGARSS